MKIILASPAVVEEHPYKKNYLGSMGYYIIIVSIIIVWRHVQLVETVISREQARRFPVVKCSLKRQLCIIFFGGEMIELVIFSAFHLRRYLDTWNFNLHFLTKHSSGKNEDFVGCFVISIQMLCIDFVESWRVLCLQFLKNNYLSLSSSK